MKDIWVILPLSFLMIAMISGCSVPSEIYSSDSRNDVVRNQPIQKPAPWQPPPGTRPSGCWDGGCHIDDSGMFP